MKNLPLILFLLFGLTGINAQFSEQSDTRGINHSFNARGLMGGGIAFFDVDQDGDDDVYLCGGLSTDDIYLNDGNGIFAKVTNQSGIELTAQYNSTGIATGDIDNDGDRDLFVTTWERFENGNEPIARNLLYLNDGNGNFTEIGETAGITEAAFSIGANFLDYNKDGFLDIYVSNHVDEPAFLYDSYGVIVGFDHKCYPNFLYLNNGDNTFTEVGASLGVASEGCALAAVPSDYDMDGDLDIFIANDFGPFLTRNELFQNNFPQDNFSEIGANNGADIPMYGMGIAVGDYDHDQDLDYYITNLGENVLLQNDNGNFTNVAAGSGVENTFANASNEFATGWGTAFMDINNDSWEDLFVTNGRIPSLSSLPTAFNDPDKLYLNNRDGTFEDISVSATVDDNSYGRGMAYSDVDLDGDLDIFVVNLNELGATSKFYINETQNDNNYIQFRLSGIESNKDAYGSKVWVYAGGEVFLKELYGGGASHVSQHTSIIHFGLGSISAIDSIRVEWTNGHVDHLGAYGINQLHHVEEGIPSSTHQPNQPDDITIAPNPFSDYITIETKKYSQQPAKITLINSTGTIVWIDEILLQQSNTIRFPDYLSEGMYFISIQTDKGNTLNKLLKF